MKKILLSTTILASLLVSASYADAAAPATVVPAAAHKAKAKTMHKKHMHKHTHTEVMTVPAATTLHPVEPVVKTATASLGGAFDFQFGWRTQSDAYKNSTNTEYSHLTTNQKNYKFDSKAKVVAKFEDKTDEGLKYGANIVLQTVSDRNTGFSKGANRSFLFLESDKGGRIELGSHDGPSKLMTVSASTLAAGDGGVDGDGWDYVSYFQTKTGLAANLIANQSATMASAIWSPKTLINRNIILEGARRINYYTPMINGFQLGASFAPDLANNATDLASLADASATLSQASRAQASQINSALKNHWSVGLKYEQNVNDKSVVALSAVMDRANSTDATVNNITSYEFGAMFGMNNFKLAASYGTDGKSLSPLTPTITGATWASNYYTAGVAYEQGPTNVSVTYSNAKAGYTDNRVKTSLVSVGADYNLAAGLTPYVSVNFYSNKADAALDVHHNKGTVVLVGTKVTF